MVPTCREEELFATMSACAWLWVPVQSESFTSSCPLPPHVPLYLLFLPSQVEDSCIANHLDERRVKPAPEDEGEQGRGWSLSESVEGEEEINVEEEEEEEGVELGSGGEKGSGEESEGEFPDTAISVAHVGGDQ